MKSLLKYDKSLNLFLVYIGDDLFQSNYTKLLTNTPQIKVIRVDDSTFGGQNLNSRHVTSATYLKLWTIEPLPKQYEEVVYMDCDILILRNPFRVLRQIEIHRSFGAVEISNSNASHLNGKCEQHFNAGFIIYDTRRYQSFKAIELFNSITDFSIYKYQDQDLLNLSYVSYWDKITNNLNYFPYPNLNLKRRINPKIIHFVGANKPWSLTRPTIFHIIYFLRYKNFIKKNHLGVFQDSVKLIHWIYAIEWAFLNFRVSEKAIRFAKRSLTSKPTKKS